MKANNKSKMVSIQEAELLALVSNRLKGRVLFPKKVEEAEALVKNIRMKES
jgi:hypothetical protein